MANRQKVIINVGEIYGQLVVIEPIPERINGRVAFKCKCSCGNFCNVIAKSLTNGNTTSCGCKRKATLSRIKTTHGCYKMVEYRLWKGMKNRCFNPNNEDFHSYGGRGITVCDEWKNDFSKFLQDVGRRPSPFLTIERKDVNKNYEPGNIEWATRKVQARNQRRRTLTDEKSEIIRRLHKDGIKTKSLVEMFGVTRSTIQKVIRGEIWS